MESLQRKTYHYNSDKKSPKNCRKPLKSAANVYCQVIQTTRHVMSVLNCTPLLSGGTSTQVPAGYWSVAAILLPEPTQTPQRLFVLLTRASKFNTSVTSE